MPWPVYLAPKQLFPTGRISFFTLVSVVGVGLGVALMLVSTSVMGGFGYQIKTMIIDTQGEVQVRARPDRRQTAAAFEKDRQRFPGGRRLRALRPGHRDDRPREPPGAAADPGL